MENIVIIGGSDAGISAAIRLRELDSRIVPTIIVADDFPNFSICGLPYLVSHEVSHWRNLAHRTKEEIENEGIRLLIEHRATSIDIKNKYVTAIDKHGSNKTIDYDKLIIGTGAISVKPRIRGVDLPGVLFLRWVTDAIFIDDFIRLNSPKRALIIGGGYIGVEMSEALTSRGLEVTIVEFMNTVMPTFDPQLAELIKEALISNGVKVHNNVAVESIERINNYYLVKGTGGFESETDIVLVSVGAEPNTILGKSIGIDTGIKGGIKVNLKMETNIPDIYAAGDCAETWHRITRKFTYMPLGTVAHKQGRIAGENVIGGNKEFAGTLGTQSVKIFNRVVARTGLNEKEAAESGFTPITIDFETWDHKVYYPQAEKIFIRVMADKSTKRILGAQMIGAYKSEVSKRIDIFATALYHSTTVQDFSNYDLSYTPPLSSPWDPVQMAVQKLEKIM